MRKALVKKRRSLMKRPAASASFTSAKKQSVSDATSKRSVDQNACQAGTLKFDSVSNVTPLEQSANAGSAVKSSFDQNTLTSDASAAGQAATQSSTVSFKNDAKKDGTTPLIQFSPSHKLEDGRPEATSVDGNVIFIHYQIKLPPTQINTC